MFLPTAVPCNSEATDCASYFRSYTVNKTNMNATQPKVVACDICERLLRDYYHKLRDTNIDMSIIICETCIKNLEKYKLIK